MAQNFERPAGPDDVRDARARLGPELADAIDRSILDMRDSEGSLDQAEEILAARAAINAVEAGNSPAVVDFRETVLKGELLAPEEIADWLSKRSEEQSALDPSGVGFSCLTVEDFGSLATDFEPRKVAMQRPLQITVRAFRTPSDLVDNPQDDGSQSVLVLETGPLGRLLALSRWLAHEFAWDESQAAGWVLTGCLPLPRAVVIYPEAGPIDATGRARWAKIKIEAAPETPSNALRAMFRIPRASLPILTRTTGLATKGPGIGSRQLKLAAFAAERNDGRTWAAILDEWNSQVDEEWRYPSYRNLARDARETYAKLMGCALDWKKGKARKSRKAGVK